MKYAKSIAARYIVAALATTYLLTACSGGEPDGRSLSSTNRDRSAAVDSTASGSQAGSTTAADRSSEDDVPAEAVVGNGSDGDDLSLTIGASDDTGDEPGTASSPSSRTGSGDDPNTEVAEFGGNHPVASDPQVSIVGQGGDEPLAEMHVGTQVPSEFRIQPPANHGTQASPSQGGPGSLSASDGCASNCITRGTAHPRGFGALLVLQSNTDADWFISVMGPAGFSEFYSSDWETSQVMWGLDHLEPGATYDVLATATDSAENTSYAWGSFTTLSQRNVSFSFGELGVQGGPEKVKSTLRYFGWDGSPLVNVTPGEGGILLPEEADRWIDLELWILLTWDADLCQVWGMNENTPDYGVSEVSCLTWNSVRTEPVDLDEKPAGANHWTSTDVSMVLHPDYATGALPADFGSLYFEFQIPINLHVTYE